MVRLHKFNKDYLLYSKSSRTTTLQCNHSFLKVGLVPGSEPLLSTLEYVHFGGPLSTLEYDRCVIMICRHGDRTPKQKMKLKVHYPRVDAGQLQKSISQISGGILAKSGDSGTWSTDSVLHVLDCFYDYSAFHDLPARGPHPEAEDEAQGPIQN